MKRVLYILLLTAALLTPEKKLDIGKLQPVELVRLGYENDLVVVETDTGQVGRGIGVAAAIANLEDTTPGVIYLDTAAQLLVSSQATGLLPDLAGKMKEDVRVSICNQKVDMAEAAKYLASHESEVTVSHALKGEAIPVLETDGERFLIKDENST